MVCKDMSHDLLDPCLFKFLIKEASDLVFNKKFSIEYEAFSGQEFAAEKGIEEK